MAAGGLSSALPLTYCPLKGKPGLLCVIRWSKQADRRSKEVANDAWSADDCWCSVGSAVGMGTVWVIIARIYMTRNTTVRVTNRGTGPHFGSTHVSAIVISGQDVCLILAVARAI
jgi:hypothetical protein